MSTIDLRYGRGPKSQNNTNKVHEIIFFTKYFTKPYAQHQQKGSKHKYFLLIRNKMQLVGVLTCRAYNNIDQVLHL